MATNFPTSLDTFPSAATLAGQTLFTTPHSTLHGNLGDSVAALEAKVGIDASAVTTSLDYNVKNLKPGLSNGRLTLTTGVPVTTADVTGATTVYFTPYRGNGISLYSTSATKWFSYTFAEISASLAGLVVTVGTSLPIPADVFAYWTGSAVALEVLNWTDNVTRATALALQDGVRVKSGDATRLYLGTVAPPTAGTCEDSLARRFVYNYYNQSIRIMRVLEGTASWSYATGVFRPMNNSTANRVQLVSGTGEDVADFMGQTLTNSTLTGASRGGIGIDSTNTDSGEFEAWGSDANLYQNGYVILRTYPPIGFHYYQALELGPGAGSVTWYGQGLRGIIGRCYG